MIIFDSQHQADVALVLRLPSDRSRAALGVRRSVHGGRPQRSAGGRHTTGGRCSAGGRRSVSGDRSITIGCGSGYS